MLETLAVISGLIVSPAPTQLRGWTPAPSLRLPAAFRAQSSIVRGMTAQTVRAPTEAILYAESTEPFVEARRSAVRDQLESYGALLPGWDGPGSSVPSARALEAAKAVIDRLPYGATVPKPMLSSDGEVGLYWDTDVAFADIVVDEPDQISLFVRNKRTDEESLIEDIPLATVTPGWLTERLGAVLDS